MELNINHVKDFVVLMDKEVEKPAETNVNLFELKKELREYDKSDGIQKELSKLSIEYYFHVLKNSF